MLMCAGRGTPSAGSSAGPSALRTARAWADGEQLFLDIRELGIRESGA
jgi:hypothetical protein